MKISEIIREERKPGEPELPPPLPFEMNANPGWYREGDSITAYHGTHLRNVADILANGINRADPRTGMISVTLDPLTAYAYASMSGAGGESDFRGAGQRATTTPPVQRAVIKLEIPREWAEEHMDPGLGGNMDAHDHTNDLVDARTRMTSREEHARWRRANSHLPGRVYYFATELRFDTTIPPGFIRGYMRRG